MTPKALSSMLVLAMASIATVVHGDFPSPPQSQGGTFDISTPGTEPLSNDNLTFESTGQNGPRNKMSVEQVRVTGPNGEDDILDPSDYEVLNDGSYAPTIQFTNFYSPGPDFTVHISGTTNKSNVGNGDVTFTWSEDPPE